MQLGFLRIERPPDIQSYFPSFLLGKKISLSEENLTKDFIRSPVGRTFLPQRLNKYHGVQKDAEHGRYHADGKPGDGKAFTPLKALLNL